MHGENEDGQDEHAKKEDSQDGHGENSQNEHGEKEDGHEKDDQKKENQEEDAQMDDRHEEDCQETGGRWSGGRKPRTEIGRKKMINGKMIWRNIVRRKFSHVSYYPAE
jgi:cobalamin biosynthesis protein CobT